MYTGLTVVVWVIRFDGEVEGLGLTQDVVDAMVSPPPLRDLPAPPCLAQVAITAHHEPLWNNIFIALMTLLMMTITIIIFITAMLGMF
jgi:hypothetical protein